jgi:hypothetical protein
VPRISNNWYLEPKDPACDHGGGVTKQVSRSCVDLGMEAFMHRGHVVPVEEAFVRPEKSGVCCPHQTGEEWALL